jgi:sugar phosphate isomerase/epimerase
MALLDRYAADPAVGFCWDLGHEQCYPPPTDLLAKYADRLLFTHLNDNYGSTSPTLSSADDLHLLPGDGKADWNAVLQRLKAAKPQTVLNFELKVRPKPGKCNVDLYGHLPLETYLQEAAHRAKALAKEYF